MDLPAQKILVERRFVANPVEMRAAAAADGAEAQEVVFGYAAKFNSPTKLYEWSDEEWWEVIEPGFFDDVLADDVRCLFNHDSNMILGRTAAQTLSMKPDENGLAFECQPLAEVSYAKDLCANIRAGNVSQCSFSFSIAAQAWEEKDMAGKRIVTRYLKKAKKLYDVGPVTFPAYESTEVGVRSGDDDDSDFFKAFKEYKEARQLPTQTEPEKTKLAGVRQRALRLLEISNK